MPRPRFRVRDLGSSVEQNMEPLFPVSSSLAGRKRVASSKHVASGKRVASIINGAHIASAADPLAGGFQGSRTGSAAAGCVQTHIQTQTPDLNPGFPSIPI